MNASKRQVLINAGANWAGFAAQVVVAFIMSPILVHALGQVRYGIWSLVESVLTYLLLFDLGVGASVVRYVARFEATRDHENMNRVFSTSICIFSAAGALALALALVVAFLGSRLLNIPETLIGEARCMLILLGVNLAVGLPLNVFPSVLDGLGRFPAKTTMRTGALLLRTGLFLVVLHLQGGLIELAWTITACNLLEHLALALAAWYYVPQLRFALALVDRTTFRKIRGYSLDAFLAMIAGRVSFQTDAIVIGAFLAPQYITFFAIAARLVEYAKNSLRTLTIVLTPAVSSLEARGDQGGIRNVLLDSTRYILWLILPIQAGLLLLGKPFLALWMGPEYIERSYPTLVILALPLFLALAQSVPARILYGLGRLRWFARAVMAEALANLLLSVLLARPLGIEGVAWGTTLPNVVLDLAVSIYVCRLLGVGLIDYVRRSFLKPLAVVCVLAVGWVAAAAWVTPASWASLLLVGGFGGMGYGMAAILVEFGPRAVWRCLQERLASLTSRRLNAGGTDGGPKARRSSVFGQIALAKKGEAG